MTDEQRTWKYSMANNCNIYLLLSTVGKSNSKRLSLVREKTTIFKSNKINQRTKIF